MNREVKMYVYFLVGDPSKKRYSAKPLPKIVLLTQNLRYEGWYMTNEIPDSY